jgi:D-alanyl-D-alanine carboxypeptidase (penicillin-binding protein 5/6)
MEQDVRALSRAWCGWVAFAYLLAVVPAGAAGGMATATKKEDGGFQSGAPTAILIEAATGTVLYDKNADQLVAPASLAKLMTAEVVFNELKEGNIKLDDQFNISVNAWRKGGAPSGGSTMFAILHSKVPVRDLIQGVIIQSPMTAASRWRKASRAMKTTSCV